MISYEKKLRKEFGVFLRTQRLKANLTQKEMAVACGYDGPQYISNIERGICTIPPKILAVMSIQYNINHRKLAKMYNNIDLKMLETHIKETLSC